MSILSSIVPSVRRLFLMGVSGFFGLVTAAQAFPPAPPFTIHGIARDSYGWSLKATDLATVVIKKNGAVIASAPVSEAARPGENFRVLLPLDTNAADPYRPGVTATGVAFTVEVRFPSTTLPVSHITASPNTVGQAGGMLFLDFSVGADSDGDGIPDSWERWQLSEMGLAERDPRSSLTTFGPGDFDGDGTSDVMEYRAGTFAFLLSDSFRLDFAPADAAGRKILRALLVVDKSYRIEASTDLRNWTTEPVRVGSPAAEAVSVIHAGGNTREENIYPTISEAERPRFYRLTLVR